MQNVINRLIGLILPAIILTLFIQASPALATFVSFEDRTAFLNAAAGAGLTATNEGFSVDPGNPFTLNDGNGNSLTLAFMPGQDASYNAGLGLLDTVPGSGQVELNSSGFSGQVHGLGFDFSVDQASGIDIRTNSTDFLHSQGNSLGSVTGFLGVLSTDGMDIGAIFQQLNANTEGSLSQLDNLVMITPAPVPIPSSLLLFGTGLAALVGWNYRRTKKS